MGQEKVLTLLTAGLGTQWDPACVGTFLEALEGIQGSDD